MPNIEIYGFVPNYGYMSFNAVNEELVRLEDKIFEALKEVGLEKESVITNITSSIFSLNEKFNGKPFLRICSTDLGEIKTIVDALRKGKIKIDIETLILSNFIPADVDVMG